MLSRILKQVGSILPPLCVREYGIDTEVLNIIMQDISDHSSLSKTISKNSDENKFYLHPCRTYINKILFLRNTRHSHTHTLIRYVCVLHEVIS